MAAISKSPSQKYLVADLRPVDDPPYFPRSCDSAGPSVRRWHIPQLPADTQVAQE